MRWRLAGFWPRPRIWAIRSAHLLAFTQWRTSWLSREAWAAVATLLVMAPLALSDWLGMGWWRGIGVLGAVLALVTVLTTSMIYAQIKAVPRWHHWLTPVYFQVFALTGGAILSGHRWIALVLLVVLAAVLGCDLAGRRRGLCAGGADLGTATGLGAIGEVTVFEQAHTAGNYLLREMIFVVGRKHAARLRVLALVFACGAADAVAFAAVLACVGAGGDQPYRRGAGGALVVFCRGRACRRPLLRDEVGMEPWRASWDCRVGRGRCGRSLWAAG